MQLHDLMASLSTLLTPENYRDYAPNGLQVEGRHRVERVVTGVTASLALLEKARELSADLVLVHHGWFWKHDTPTITGIRRARVAELIASNMSLAAFHLPLDDHPELGNNALLGKALGFRDAVAFGEMHLGRIGFCTPVSCADLAARITQALDRPPLVVGPADGLVRRPAWCSGAAQDMLEDAALAGADAFLSGEISERTTHIARELGIPYFACGHHATERFGIQALGDWIARTHGLEVTFVDIPNPV